MSAAPTPNPLVDQYQTHLKFNGRTPRTIEELLVAKADYEHSRRRAEIKAIAPKLAQFDPFLPPLLERGIRLSYRDVRTNDNGKTLSIASPFFEKDDALYAALIELGFKEVERTKFLRDTQLVTLKYGRALLVQIEVKKVESAATSEVAGSAA